jgi:endonuclease/exonuclease/phosphatase (EEP) superfamily protein YafD
MADQSTTAEELPTRQSLVWRGLIALAAAGTVVVMLLTVGGFFARYHWRLEQMCHFRVQYFWLLTFGGLVLLGAGRRRLAGAAIVTALANLAIVAPIYWPSGQPPARGPTFKLLSFNVLGSSERYGDVLAYIRHEQADAVVLMEIRPNWADQIETLDDLYPHQHIVPRRDNFGIALLSRRPWANVDTRELGTAGVPSIVAELSIGGQKIALVATHPLPPGTQATASARNEQLAEIAQLVRQQSLPAVVVGDLNVTSYSPHFHDLIRDCGLRDTRQGQGIQASWSSRLPLLDIPIDHCLVPPEIHVASRQVGPHLGSDHRPVIVELRAAALAQP